MKKIIVIAFIFFLAAPISAFALTYTDDIISSGVYESANDRVRVNFKSWRSFDALVVNQYDFNDTLVDTTTWTNYSATGHYFTENGEWELIYYRNGEQVGVDYVTITEIQGDPGGDSGGEAGADPIVINNIITIPGWNDVMGKMNEILSAIPPAPNWSEVANTFSNAIVPNMISELESSLGRAPSLPNTPNQPNRMTGGLDKPTGQQASGLEDSSFGASDIKAGAETIKVKEDPTGGFNILDPVGGLPSQEEFRNNIPDDPEMIAPEVPETNAEAPEVPEVEGTAPEPPSESNPAPGAPSEGENVAPSPGEVEGTAPTPPENSNPAPGSPTEGDNFAPQPGMGDGSTAPFPGEGENIAPNPSDGGGYAPLPGVDGSTAPIPGESGQGAPLPKEQGTAPLPGETG